MTTIRNKSEKGYADGFRDDEVLARDIRDALEAETRLDTRQIELEVQDGMAVLEGWVLSEDDRARALMIARNVLGVKDVQVRLMVQHAPGKKVPLVPRERAGSSLSGWIKRLFGGVAGDVH